MSQPRPGADKTTWRAWARAMRADLDMASLGPKIVAGLRSSGLIGVGARVLVYDPLPDEPDVGEALQDADPHLTRTPDEGLLSVHRADAARETHHLGFEQPLAGSAVVPVEDIDVVLVPGLAFDRGGGRLGRGAGHYDRLLPGMRPGIPLIGVVPGALVVDALPVSAHDHVMTHLATEDGVVETDGLIARTRDWIASDPDPVTRAELAELLAAGDRVGLESRMGGELTFGTAGIRGEVGAGTNRMNRAVVIRTTAGLAAVLVERGTPGPVVVGFDGRIDSRRFAEDVIGVLAAAGIRVEFFPDRTPTPLVSYAARVRRASAAVVITASHNPPRDNGYKVYDANSAQIIPPTDTAIAAAIAAAPRAVDVARVEGAMHGHDRVEEIDTYLVESYLADIGALRTPPPATNLSIVYTPLHGVGGDPAVRALAAAGYRTVHVVAEQAEPDGRFPTVEFPNPEEPGALDLAEALAGDVGADLVLANDPDADRLAVMVPNEGGWRALTGNEIGALLGDYLLANDVGEGTPLVVTSIVSSALLGRLAAEHGARFEQTLTGFKWITNAAMDLEQAEGARFVFGYEEALGYTVGPVVRDKDGISAAVHFADLVAHASAAGETVLDRLGDIYRRHGVWATTQNSIRRAGPEGLDEIAAAMRRIGSDVPERLGDRAVAAVTDFGTGGEGRPRWLPNTPLVVLDLEGGGRVLVRPSGTEPKLKIYVDLPVPVGDRPVAEVEASAALAATAMGDELADHLGL